MIGRRVPGITLQNGPLKNSTRSRISLPIIKRRCLCPTVTHILKRRKLTSTPQMVVDEGHHKVPADTDWVSTHPAPTQRATTTVAPTMDVLGSHFSDTQPTRDDPCGRPLAGCAPRGS